MSLNDNFQLVLSGLSVKKRKVVTKLMQLLIVQYYIPCDILSSVVIPYRVHALRSVPRSDKFFTGLQVEFGLTYDKGHKLTLLLYSWSAKI